jgi:methane monooxygenase component A gamma chain
MANYKIHDNPVRDAWTQKIAGLKKLAEGAAFLSDFRKTYLSPFRTDYSLDLDALWIECKIEEKVAVLKAAEFNDEQLLNNNTCGTKSQIVADAVLAKMEACTDKYEAERIHIHFRQANKPPIMTTNVFMDTDRILGTKLMELRNTDYYALSLADLRKARGVNVITVQ